MIDAKVSDIMRRDIPTVTPSSSLGDAARLLADDSLSSVPVVEDGRLVGIIGQADLIFQEVGGDEVDVLPTAFPILGAMVFLEPLDHWREQFRRAFGVTVADVMTADPVTVSPDDTGHEAARRMVEHGVNRLPVVDVDQAVVGIISRADIVRALASQW